jgi:hypothetical protein
LAPVGDVALAEVLERRFDRWQQARSQARIDAARPPPLPATAQDDPGANSAEEERETEERHRRVELALAAAEAALAEGELAQAAGLLHDIDQERRGRQLAEPLRGRRERLLAELARLRGWQQWGGSRARDELLLQAEALAATASVDAAGESGLQVSLPQRIELIETLRARWREVEHASGGTRPGAARRFDAALAAAFAPVAAHKAAQNQQRQQNLSSRRALLDALDAVPLPVAEGENAADWKPLIAALAQWRAAWRALGPVLHTVPRAEQEKLLERMRASVGRLEQPLADAQAAAEERRQRLIVDMRELAAALAPVAAGEVASPPASGRRGSPGGLGYRRAGGGRRRSVILTTST